MIMCSHGAPLLRLGGDLDLWFLDHAGALARLAFSGAVALTTRGWHSIQELYDGSVEKGAEAGAMAPCTLSIPLKRMGRQLHGIAVGTLAHGAPPFGDL